MAVYPDPASNDEFADVMSELASGVVLVTCRVDGKPWGMTVTAFTSVSAEPPTVLVSLRSHTPVVKAIRETGRFGVSLLAQEQVLLARYGSTPGASKFLDSPVAEGALGHLDCEVTEDVQVADHTVLFGRVDRARMLSGASPLVYHRRAYRALAQTERSTPCLAS
jgi:flavin reductase ActVB